MSACIPAVWMCVAMFKHFLGWRTAWSGPGHLLVTRHRHGSLYPRHTATRPPQASSTPSPSQVYYWDVAQGITEAPEHCLNPLYIDII